MGDDGIFFLAVAFVLAVTVHSCASCLKKQDAESTRRACYSTLQELAQTSTPALRQLECK